MARRATWSPAVPGPIRPLTKLNLYPACGLNSYEGYGRVEIGLVRGLTRTGIATNLLPDPALPTLLCGNPKWAASPLMENQRVWLLTMIESTRASQPWVDNINAHCERVLLPVAEMRPLMRDSGVRVPIHILPLGVDAFEFPYRQRAYSEPFTFLTYSYGDLRKGAELAVMAFKMLYDGDRRFRLIIKARDGGTIAWLRHVANDQITVVSGNIPEATLRDLYAQAHAFVFPSRAEGFGLPPREAVISGLPTIATRWLGMADVDCWGYGLGVKAMQPAQYERIVNNAAQALWAEPDFDDLLHWMQHVVANYERIARHVERQRAYLLTYHTWRKSAEHLSQLLEEHG